MARPLEHILMAQCNISYKQARALVNTARTNLGLSLTVRWSAELEEESLRLYREQKGLPVMCLFPPSRDLGSIKESQEAYACQETIPKRRPSALSRQCWSEASCSSLQATPSLLSPRNSTLTRAVSVSSLDCSVTSSPPKSILRNKNQPVLPPKIPPVKIVSSSSSGSEEGTTTTSSTSGSLASFLEEDSGRKNVAKTPPMQSIRVSATQAQTLLTSSHHSLVSFSSACSGVSGLAPPRRPVRQLSDDSFSAPEEDEGEIA